MGGRNISAVNNVEKTRVSQATTPHGTSSTGSAASDGGAIGSRQTQSQAVDVSPVPQPSLQMQTSADVTIVIVQTATKTIFTHMKN